MATGIRSKSTPSDEGQEKQVSMICILAGSARVGFTQTSYSAQTPLHGASPSSGYLSHTLSTQGERMTMILDPRSPCDHPNPHSLPLSLVVEVVEVVEVIESDSEQLHPKSAKHNRMLVPRRSYGTLGDHSHKATALARQVGLWLNVAYSIETPTRPSCWKLDGLRILGV